MGRTLRRVARAGNALGPASTLLALEASGKVEASRLDPESTLPTRHLSCHCGAISLDADIELDNLMTCNCSLCGRTGAFMAFVPISKLSNITGEANLIDYQFGPKRIHHPFCKTCGARPFARGPGHDGQEWAMVNVRCIEGLDVHTLEVARRYDGKSA